VLITSARDRPLDLDNLSQAFYESFPNEDFDSVGRVLESDKAKASRDALGVVFHIYALHFAVIAEKRDKLLLRDV